jgi:hypothetical protein
MRPTSRELINAIVTALEQQVAPTVQDKWVASVLRSATQLLNHIAVRTEDEGRVLIEDNDDIRQVLEAVQPRLVGKSNVAELCAAIEQALNAAEPAAYDTAGLGVRNEAYQAAVEQLLRHRDRVRQASGGTATHDELRAYLRRRLKREHHLYFPVFTGPPF